MMYILRDDDYYFVYDSIKERRSYREFSVSSLMNGSNNFMVFSDKINLKNYEIIFESEVINKDIILEKKPELLI